jgi:hypothetical protein
VVKYSSGTPTSRVLSLAGNEGLYLGTLGANEPLDTYKSFLSLMIPGPYPQQGGLQQYSNRDMNDGMQHLSINARSLVEVELAHLYQRRLVVDQLISSLERYAKATAKDSKEPHAPAIQIANKLAS